jgi:hypothetical protein
MWIGPRGLGVSHFMTALPGNADPIGTLRRIKVAYDAYKRTPTPA